MNKNFKIPLKNVKYARRSRKRMGSSRKKASVGEVVSSSPGNGENEKRDMDGNEIVNDPILP